MSYTTPCFKKAMDYMSDPENTETNIEIIIERGSRGEPSTQAIINGCVTLVEKVNRFTYISEMMRKTIYKDHVSIYLRYNSQYRHMWE